MKTTEKTKNCKELYDQITIKWQVFKTVTNPVPYSIQMLPKGGKGPLLLSRNFPHPHPTFQKVLWTARILTQENQRMVTSFTLLTLDCTHYVT